MAQQDLVEDANTDFSGLASSLLPPSGAFLSGWTPEKWQRFTPSHNIQGVQRSVSNPYTGTSFQNDPEDSSYEPYDPYEYGMADHAPSSGEMSGSASAAPSDSAQLQFYQVCSATCCGTSLTDVAGDEQQRLQN